MGAFLFLYLDSGGIQPSMGHTMRLLLKPSENREFSWKAKLKPCSSLLMICTVSLASRPEEETPALSGGLLPAPEVSRQALLCGQEGASLPEILQLLFFPPPSSWASFFLWLCTCPSSPGGIPALPLELRPIDCLLPPQLSWDSGDALSLLVSSDPGPSCCC